MKNLLKSAIFIAILGIGAPAAEAGPNVKDLIKTLMGTPKVFCEKGNGTSQITIRSANGELCKLPSVAAVAVAVCGKRDDFAGSHCGKNAAKVLAVSAGNSAKLLEAAKAATQKLKGNDLSDFKEMLIKNKKAIEAANPDAQKEIEDVAAAAPAA